MRCPTGIVLLGILAWMGCQSGSNPGGGTNGGGGSVLVKSAQGGTVLAGSAKLVIPAGALSQDSTVRLVLADQRPTAPGDPFQQVGPSVQVDLGGAILNQPASLSTPFTAGSQPAYYLFLETGPAQGTGAGNETWVRPIADLSNETILRLAQVPGIIGIKEASGDMGRDAELMKALRAERRDNFAVYSGDDLTALSLMLLGGHGVISVTANVAPKLMAEMCRAALKGDLQTARACNDRLLPLHRKLFVEANPIPLKWALAQMGLAENVLRLPLVPLSEQYCNTVRDALREAGCLG